MRNVVIVDACRTAVGSFGGSLRPLKADALARAVMIAALERTGLEPGQVDEIFLGHCRQSSDCSNTARYAALLAGIPETVPASTVMCACASGMLAVNCGFNAIRTGQDQVVLAGGTESMSNAIFYLSDARWGVGTGTTQLKDSLTEAQFCSQPQDIYGRFNMGITAENIAAKMGITREEQDRFALASQEKARAAIAAGRFKDEIVPLTVPQGRKKPDKIFDTDEFPRETSLKLLSRLKPAFRRMGVVKGCDGAKEQAQAVRKRCKDELDEIGALLAVSESEQLEDLEAMAPAMLALVQLTEDFTAAYQAERDLDRLMYQDTGLYRNQQYAKASTVLLQTMYEEIPILWDQEMEYRPSFSAAGDTVTLPVICQKICGVKDGNASQYWLDIKKLITPDTEVVRSVPWVQGTDPNPVKPYATQFLKNGKLLRGKIKSHSAYLYGILRAEMQEHLLDKLQLLLDQKLIRGTFENGTEYTVIATALNLPKDLLRKIQKFDFTKKNPKLIYINPTEERISLEDSILTAFLSLVGFDVLFFVPTGYQCIEQHFTRPFASETQIGDYLYDLRIPDFNTVQESGLHSIRKLFGRSI